MKHYILVAIATTGLGVVSHEAKGDEIMIKNSDTTEYFSCKEQQSEKIETKLNKIEKILEHYEKNKESFSPQEQQILETGYDLFMELIIIEIISAFNPDNDKKYKNKAKNIINTLITTMQPLMQ